MERETLNQQNKVQAAESCAGHAGTGDLSKGPAMIVASCPECGRQDPMRVYLVSMPKVCESFACEFTPSIRSFDSPTPNVLKPPAAKVGPLFTPLSRHD